MEGLRIAADLSIPPTARGVVAFAHGSGSGRHSERNRYVAGEMQTAGFATLLVDLLAPEEEAVDRQTTTYRFDIPLLAARLWHATQWLLGNAETSMLPVYYFGASTGAAAALVAAADHPLDIKAIVSRGGRPDLAGGKLRDVRAATLLIVGADDHAIIPLNQSAYQELLATKAMHIVPGATHLFEEHGALEEVADVAVRWFDKH